MAKLFQNVSNMHANLCIMVIKGTLEKVERGVPHLESYLGYNLDKETQEVWHRDMYR